jgi:hypothetical protein
VSTIEPSRSLIGNCDVRHCYSNQHCLGNLFLFVDQCSLLWFVDEKNIYIYIYTDHIIFCLCHCPAGESVTKHITKTLIQLSTWPLFSANLGRVGEEEYQ